jgi:glycosyltransferase involved in cell wall biosynthesis
MRVLHVIPSLDARDGGPSVALPLMARSLAMQGITVEVAATMSEEDARDQGVRFGVAVERDGFTVRFFKRQTTFYKISLPLLRWLRDHIRDYALVHHHALFSFAPIGGAWFARKQGVPYLMRPLGLLNTWGMKHRRRWIKALSFRLLDRAALNHAAAIHFTSKEEEREAARLKLKSKSVVVPLGIDLQPMTLLATPQKFFAMFPNASGKRCVLFLSRLDPKKGLETLLDAFSAMRRISRDTVLVIAGSGDERYEAVLRLHASRLALDGELIWTGFLQGEEKRSALAAADIFVLPSESENFGIALVEALAAGKACIATEGVAVAREMQQADAGLVVPCGDAAALTVALTQLVDDDDLRSRLSMNAARLAAERYSLSAMGTSLARVYRDILGQPVSS